MSTRSLAVSGTFLGEHLHMVTRVPRSGRYWQPKSRRDASLTQMMVLVHLIMGVPRIVLIPSLANSPSLSLGGIPTGHKERDVEPVLKRAI